MKGYYPQQMRGHIVTVEVSNNGQDFTVNGRQFLYLEDIEDPHVSISELQISGMGSTPTFIRGNNFGKLSRYFRLPYCWKWIEDTFTNFYCPLGMKLIALT